MTLGLDLNYGLYIFVDDYIIATSQFYNDLKTCKFYSDELDIMNMLLLCNCTGSVALKMLDATVGIKVSSNIWPEEHHEQHNISKY